MDEKIKAGRYYWISVEEVSTPEQLSSMLADAGFVPSDFNFFYVPGDGFYTAISNVDTDSENAWLDTFETFGFATVIQSVQGFYLR